MTTGDRALNERRTDNGQLFKRDAPDGESNSARLCAAADRQTIPAALPFAFASSRLTKPPVLTTP